MKRPPLRTWVFHPGAWVVGLFIWLMGPTRVEGLEHLPREGAAIIVANHCSLLDPPILGWATGHQIGRVVHFMAKVEMRRWPLIGWLADHAGVFFVRRGEGDRGAQRTALDHLAAGRLIGVFPEGTRSPDGQLAEGRPGVALVAARTGAPIIPVGISGSERQRPDQMRWTHRAPITVRIGPPFTLEHQPDARLDRAGLQRDTDRIMRAIAELLPEGQRGLYRT